MRKQSYHYPLFIVSAISLAFVVSMANTSPVVAAEAPSFPIYMDSRSAPECKGEWSTMSAGPLHPGPCGVGCEGSRIALEERGCSRNVKVGDKWETERKIYLAPALDGIPLGCLDSIRNGTFRSAVCRVCGDGVVQTPEECDYGKSNGTGTSSCDSACKIRPLCGNGIKNSNEECDDGNTKDDDGCSSVCKNEPPNLVFSPSSVPAGIPPTVAACNVSKYEIITGQDCGEESTSCVKLLNKADKDKAKDKTEVSEEYILRPYTIGKGKNERTQWMELISPRTSDQKENVEFVLLGAETDNPDKPLAAKTVLFESTLAPLEKLFDISALTPLKNAMGRLAFAIASHSFVDFASWRGGSAIPAVALSQVGNVAGQSALSPTAPVVMGRTITMTVGVAREGGDRMVVVIPKDLTSSISSSVVFIDPRFKPDASVSTVIRNATDVSQNYTAKLYETFQEVLDDGVSTKEITTKVAEKDITVDARVGACRHIGTPASSSGSSLRILVVNLDPAQDIEGFAKDLFSNVTAYTPLNELKKRINMNFYDHPLDVSCFSTAGDARERAACADEIIEALQGVCAGADDIVVVNGLNGPVSWSVDSTPVVLAVGAVKNDQAGAILAHAIASRLGLGDEFEYDDQTAQFSKFAPNCRIAGKVENLPLVWRSIQGQGEKELTIGMFKGCGDFPEVGVKPTTASIMSNPFQFAGNPDGFGKVNQAFLRKAFQTLIK